MSGPLVSVVTATRNRHAEIGQAIKQVRAQTYRPLEHVIVSDGPDPVLAEIVDHIRCDQSLDPDQDRVVPIVFAETGRVWSDELAYSPGAAPFLVAQMLAHGPLQMWLSDDETMVPWHIEELVRLLENGGHDFVYSRAEWWVPGQPELARIIGTDPPQPDQITNALYRTALLDYGTFEPHIGAGTDWHQVKQWMAAGASFAMNPQVTFSHRADQIGGNVGRRIRQPLRGLGGQGVWAGPRWKGHPVDPITGQRLAESGASL